MSLFMFLMILGAFLILPSSCVYYIMHKTIVELKCAYRYEVDMHERLVAQYLELRDNYEKVKDALMDLKSAGALKFYIEYDFGESEVLDFSPDTYHIPQLMPGPIIYIECLEPGRTTPKKPAEQPIDSPDFEVVDDD